MMVKLYLFLLKPINLLLKVLNLNFVFLLQLLVDDLELRPLNFGCINFLVVEELLVNLGLGHLHLGHLLLQKSNLI
jgi:hypothetical protein